MSNISKLMRWSGLASMLGGVLFSISIILHPLRHGEAVNNSPYSAIHVLIAIALTLVLFGLVGLFLRQAEAMTSLGLVGFILAFMRVGRCFAQVSERWRACCANQFDTGPDED